MPAFLKSPSVWSLLVMNFAFMLAAIFYHWDVFEMIFIFWMENLVIGFYNILKMAMVKKTGAKKLGVTLTAPLATVKIILIAFFIFHYYLFCLVHGLFIVVLFGEHSTGQSGVIANIASLNAHTIVSALIAMLISHGLSFWRNYCCNKEYDSETLAGLMKSPYSRILIVHVVVMAAGFLILMTGFSTIMIVLFSLLKTGVDLKVHLSQMTNKVA